VTAGIDYSWSNDWFPNGLYLAIEYFYNGAAGSVQMAQDRLNSRSKHLMGGLLGYDLTTLWRLDLLLIADVQQSGWFVAPSLKWSVVEDVEITVFAQLPQGIGTSEFAAFEALYAARLDWYF